MSDTAPHEFDEGRASRFWPRSDLLKTAVLVDVADASATTTIRTSFGDQSMRGPFYVVVVGDETYAAARTEFEASHERVGSGTWRKVAPVDAYRTDMACRVHTEIDGEREVSTLARPGDWIVRQASGEVMVVTPDAFTARYRPYR